MTSGSNGGRNNPILHLGDSGEAVTKLQRELVAAGFAVEPDGNFGEHTKSAVIAFQTHSALTPDGVVGPQTWAGLRANTG
jgi:peptidoglycan hydrolase-like protein with peptidoglycan-binding domain